MSFEAFSLAVLLVHFAATLYMVGLIWFVQVVHYPLLAGVGSAGFVAYEREHVSRTGPVVGVAMLAELVTAVLLLFLPLPAVSTTAAALGLVLLAAVWLSTATLQVPCHRALSIHFDPVAHQRLVSTNWIRTAGWSLRGGLVAWMVFRTSAAGLS